MNVAIDISPLKNANSYRGVGIYTKRLVHSLNQFQPEHSCSMVENEQEMEQLRLTKKSDLIHYPYFDPFFLTLPVRKDIPIVVTIHDVIPLIFPKMFPKGFKGWLKLQVQKTKLQMVDAIITDSYCSKKDIAQHLGIPRKKIHVVHLAVEDIYKRVTDSVQLENIKHKYHLPENFLIKVGDINPTKNFRTTFQALADLPDSHLVLVGKALTADTDGKQIIPELQNILNLIEQLNLSKRVHRLGFVPDEDMPALYSSAKATLQNSIYEGFGLPALESLSCGTPVIASNQSSIPEVVGAVGIMVEPESKEQLVEAIQHIYGMDDSTYAELVAKSLVQAESFSMRKMAQETYNIYATINQKNRSDKK